MRYIKINLKNKYMFAFSFLQGTIVFYNTYKNSKKTKTSRILLIQLVLNQILFIHHIFDFNMVNKENTR